jgi:hypothetical protein
VVELDSRQAHGTPKVFEDDSARDRHLPTRGDGDGVARITYRQLRHDRPTLAAELRALLRPTA